MGALVAGTAVAGGVAVCSADHVPSIDYGWSHHGLLASYDYAAYVIDSTRDDLVGSIERASYTHIPYHFT